MISAGEKTKAQRFTPGHKASQLQGQDSNQICLHSNSVSLHLRIHMRKAFCVWGRASGCSIVVNQGAGWSWLFTVDGLHWDEPTGGNRRALVPDSVAVNSSSAIFVSCCSLKQVT